MKMVVAMALLAFSGLRRQLLCTFLRRSRSFGGRRNFGRDGQCGDSNSSPRASIQRGDNGEMNPSW